MPGSGGRARCKTPPRITAHKPPKPATPPPGWRPSTAAAGDAGANSSASTALSPSSSGTPSTAGAAYTPRRGDGTPLAAVSSSPAPAPPLASLGSRGGAAASHCGYLAKLGDVSNVLLGKRTWKRRFFVLDAGHLAYYESAGQYEAGAAPMKGNRLDVREYVMAVTAGDVPLPDGADIALEPAGAAAAASPAGGGAPPSTPGHASSSIASRLHLPRLGSSPAGGGGGGVTSPGSPASGGGGAAGTSPSTRVWKFRCESAEDVQAWSRALAAHGCRRRGAA
jgi:hypothetical protein